MRNLKLSAASINSHRKWWAVRLHPKIRTKPKSKPPNLIILTLRDALNLREHFKQSLFKFQEVGLSSHGRDGTAPKAYDVSVFGWRSCTLYHMALRQDLFPLNTLTSHVSCHMSYPSEEVGCESIFILARTLILFVINLPPLSHPSSLAKWLFKYSLNLF